LKESRQKSWAHDAGKFLRQYLPFSQELVFERILKLSFFIRKYLCSVILNTDTLYHVELLVRRLVTFHPSFIRAMPLKAFISISKTFLCFLNYKVANPHCSADKVVRVTRSPGVIFEQYLDFCLSYFSSEFHYFQKSETEYSVTDAATYHKAVEDLHSVFLALHRFTDVQLKDTAFGHSVGSFSFFNRFVGKLSGVSPNLKMAPKPCFFGAPRKPPAVSIQYVLQGVLYLMKHKIDGLRARMYYNYRYVRMNAAFDSFKLKRLNPELIFDSIFEVNPVCALQLRDA
jgi:hypothetical protein